MSGRLVSRCSVAWLWSEWDALETLKATQAVSYVSPSCTGMRRLFPSLAFSRQQSCELSIISRVTFPLLVIGRAAEGVFPQTAHCKPPLRAPPISEVNSRTLCAAAAGWKYSDLILLYDFSSAEILVLRLLRDFSL